MARSSSGFSGCPPSDRRIDGQYRDPGMREYLDRLAAKDDRGDAVRPCEAMTIRSQPFDPAVSMIA